VWDRDGERINMIVSVASGKGGTGKTLVATSLALSLEGRYRVQLLDCDVEEPNDHIFLRPVIASSEAVCIQVPHVDEQTCIYCGRCAEVCAYNAIAVFHKNILVFQQLCHGCGACSYLCPEESISEEAREIGVVDIGHSNDLDFVQGRLTVGESMPTPIIRKVKEHINRDGVVIIDVSPGTSCPVVESVKGSDFCLLVTEPTPFGLNDLALAVGVTKELKIPCGVVINRAGVGNSVVEEYCRQESIPNLLTIPLDVEIARLYSKGITLVESMPNWKERFLELFDDIREIVNEGSRSLKR
jgi:MinD superfamily P-loop ATPase